MTQVLHGRTRSGARTAPQSRADKALRRRLHLRTCVGCGERHPQAELVRVRRRSDGRVVLSMFAGHGRSAYVCPNRTCIDRAAQRRGLERSLRGPRGMSVTADDACRWPGVANELGRQLLSRSRGAGHERNIELAPGGAGGGIPSRRDRSAALLSLHQRLIASGEEVV